MAVIQKQMAPLDVNDVAGSLNTIDGYIRYMAEMIEFSSGVTRRKLTQVGAEGMDEVLKAIEEINGEISRLSSSLSSLSGGITGLSGQINELSGQIQGLEERVTALEG